MVCLGIQKTHSVVRVVKVSANFSPKMYCSEEGEVVA